MLAAMVTGLAAASAAQPPPPAEVLERAAGFVEQYLSVARTIVARELVTLQPLDSRLSPEGGTRTLEYELRLTWEPSHPEAAAAVHRELRRVDGRAPRPGDAAGCLVPVMPEPLTLLLPSRRAEFTFGTAEGTTYQEAAAWRLSYAPRREGSPSLRWIGDCGTLELPGFVRGAVIVDAGTYAVRRLDESLTRPLEMRLDAALRRPGWGETLAVDRVDVSTSFGPVTFEDPDETLWLPLHVRRLTIVRTPAARRLEVVQRFSNHRRFVTGARVEPR